MSDSQSNPKQPPSSDGDGDIELKQALLAAFGDEGLSLLDDGDEDDGPASSGMETSANLPISPIGFDEGNLGGDESPLIRFVLDLNNAIYAERPAEDHLNSKGTRIVLFSVGEQQYGLPICNIREIARCPQVTPLPYTPSWLRGVASLRGQITSVIDFRNLLDDSSPPPAVNEKIIVVQGDEGDFCTAIVVDHVIGQRSFDSDQGDVSELSQAVASIASSVLKIEQVNTILIDAKLLFECVALPT